MKTILNILKYVCYVCSFPLFLVFAIIASLNNIKQGGSYGLLTYVSIILPIVFTLIWLAMVIVQEVKLHKPDVKNVAKKIKKQTCKQVAFSLLLACGVMFALDAILPSVFPPLASNTIYYEDIAEEDSANERANLNKSMLDTIIARSVLTGIIGDWDGNGYTHYYTYYKTSNKDANGNDTGYYTGRVVDKDDNPLVICKYGYYVRDITDASFTSSPYDLFDAAGNKLTYYNGNYVYAETDTLKNKDASDRVVIYDATQSKYVLESDPTVVSEPVAVEPYLEPATPALKSDAEIEEMNEVFATHIQKYIDEGMKNDEVKSIMNADGQYNLKASINLSGYEAWCGPWVDLANDNRMTIPVVLNLILGNRKAVKSTETYGTQYVNEDGARDTVDTLYDYPWYNPKTCKVEYIKLSWTVLDMMGDGYTYDPDNLTATSSALTVDLSGLTGSGGLFKLVTDLELGSINVGSLLESLGLIEYDADGTVSSSVLTESKSLLGIIEIPSLYYVLDSILTSVTYAVGNTTVAGTPTYDSNGVEITTSGWMSGFAPLYLKLENADGSTAGIVGDYYISTVGDAPTQLGVYASNYSKGTIDYMRFMWVDSNALIFAITGLFAIRKTCYIFSGIIVLLAIAIGAIRMKLYRMDHPGTDGRGDKKKEENADENTEEPVATDATPADVPAEEGNFSNPYDMNDNTQYESTTFYNN